MSFLLLPYRHRLSLPVLLGRNAEILLEAFAEIVGITKAAQLGNRLDLQPCCPEQMQRRLHPELAGRPEGRQALHRKRSGPRGKSRQPDSEPVRTKNPAGNNPRRAWRDNNEH